MMRKIILLAVFAVTLIFTSESIQAQHGGYTPQMADGGAREHRTPTISRARMRKRPGQASLSGPAGMTPDRMRGGSAGRRSPHFVNMPRATSSRRPETSRRPNSFRVGRVGGMSGNVAD